MARVPYVDKTDLPEESRHLVESRAIRPDGTLNVHRAIGNNVAVLEAFRQFTPPLWQDSGLTDRQRELAILTVAHQLGSRYEWHQHVTYAVDDVLSPAEIRALAAGEFESFDDRDTALVEYVRRFAAMDVDDSTHADLADFFDDATIVGLGMLAMGYVGLAHALDAFGVEIEDDEFVGWDLETR